MRRAFCFGLAPLALAGLLAAQQAAEVQGEVKVQHLAASSGDNAGVVVWLISAGAVTPAAPASHFRMAQRGKEFIPRLLVVPVGATVDFPNYDPFFHNVFSLGDARPFDLGLYQAGGSRSQVFSRPGVSYVFCNIHPQMSAAIVAVPTALFDVSNAAGHLRISHVAPGDYQLHIWYARAQAAALEQMTKPVHVAGDTTLPSITIAETSAPAAHKNKYGQDYNTLKGYGPGGGGT